MPIPEPDLVKLERRFDLSADELSAHIQQNFGGSLLSLRQLEPLIREMLRRFKHLPRTIGVDGKRPSIAGCTTFKMWCRTILNRTDRTVRYMLAGGSKPNPETKKEKTSAKPKTAAQIRAFLDTQVSLVEGLARRQIVQAISEAAAFYGKREERARAERE